MMSMNCFLMKSISHGCNLRKEWAEIIPRRVTGPRDAVAGRWAVRAAGRRAVSARGRGPCDAWGASGGVPVASRRASGGA